MSLEIYNEAVLIFRKINLAISGMQDMTGTIPRGRYPGGGSIDNRNLFKYNPNESGGMILLGIGRNRFYAESFWRGHIITYGWKVFFYEGNSKKKERCNVSEFDEAWDFQLSTQMNDLDLRNYYLFNLFKDAGIDDILCRKDITVQELDNYLYMLEQEKGH